MPTANKPGRWIVIVGLLGLAAILYTRLIPFDFNWNGHIPLERVTWRPLTIRDVPLNILLFIPFGFGLSGFLARARPALPAARRVLAAAILLSAALETVQMFLPERAPSLADVAANAIGAMLGYALFRAWAMGLGRALNEVATRRNLMIGLVLYGLGVALLTAYLYRSVQLSNWDSAFPLVVGNEATGKREWSGRVEALTLAAGDSDRPAFYAPYDLTGEAPFGTSTPSSSAPPLDWHEGPATPQNSRGVNVGPGEWLATDDPLAGFSDTARATGSFAIETIVATAGPSQRGPARIVSVSADAERRNVTIGQEFDSLIIRLRTPAGGENGQKPELIVPDVFADEQPHHLVVAYDAPVLRATVDNEPYALSLAPGAAFFPGFMTENRWPVDMSGNPYQYDMAYWGLIIGVGALLFGGPAAAKHYANRGRAI